MVKTALVTGASSAIGRAAARELAGAGFNLAAHYHSHVEPLRSLESAAEELGVTVKLFSYDLRDCRQAEEMVSEVAASYSRIDVLVNTIGPFYYRDLLSVTPEDWREAIETNLQIGFNVTYFAREYLCQTQGHIVNFGFSGVENLKSRPMSAGYCAAKAGVVVLTKSLAAALAPRKVRVNAICPGLVEEGTSSEEERQQMARQIPFGRPARPQEIASLLRWLVTESPPYLTGALIPLAGAWEY